MAVTFAGQTLTVGPGILGSNQSLALACWVNITSRAGFSQFLAVNHTGDGVTTFDGQDLLACDDTTGPTLDVYGGSYSQSTFRTIDNTTWGLGEWHHIAMTYNATNGDVIVYFDGVASGVGGAALPTRGPITEIDIGPFAGQIQDVHVWSSNIASVQITPLTVKRRWIGGGASGLTLLQNWYPFFAPDTALSDFTGKNQTLSGTTPGASTSSPPSSWGSQIGPPIIPAPGVITLAGAGLTTSNASAGLSARIPLVGTGLTTSNAAANVTGGTPPPPVGGSGSAGYTGKRRRMFVVMSRGRQR